MARFVGRALCGLLALKGVNAADLLTVYQVAREGDPNFAAASAALDAAHQRVPEARSVLWPSIGVTANKTRTIGETSYSGSPVLGRGFYGFGWTVQLTQPVFRLQDFAAWDEAEAIEAQAEAQYRSAQQDLILRVSQTYFDILVAEETLAAATAQLRADQEQLTAAERGFEKGTVAVTDVYEARSRAAAAGAQRLAAEGAVDARKAALEAITGQLPSELATLRHAAEAVRPDPDKVQEWIDRARDQSPAVEAAMAAAAAATSEVRRLRAQRLPSIDLVASVGRTYSSGNITNPINYATNVGDRQIGVQLSMPLLDGGGMHAQVMEASANLRRAEAELEAARRKATADVRQSYADIASGLAQVTALQQAVEFGESSVNGNRAGYRLGIRINIDVLDAEQQLFSARRDLAKARYDSLLAGMRLKAAVGGLSESDLTAINSLLGGEATATGSTP